MRCGFMSQVNLMPLENLYLKSPMQDLLFFVLFIYSLFTPCFPAQYLDMIKLLVFKRYCEHYHSFSLY